MSQSVLPPAALFGPPALRSLSCPSSGLRPAIEIARLGHITLAVGSTPESGQSHLLSGVHSAYGGLWPGQSILTVTVNNIGDFRARSLVALRDRLRSHPRHPAHRRVAVDNFIDQMQLPRPIWSEGLTHLPAAERGILAMAICVTIAPPKSVVLIDHLDHVAAGERWPLIWRFVLDRMAMSDGAQVIAATCDSDIAGALAVAKQTSPAAETTLVVVGGERAGRGKLELSEFYEWDAETVRKIPVFLGEMYGEQP